MDVVVVAVVVVVVAVAVVAVAATWHRGDVAVVDLVVVVDAADFAVAGGFAARVQIKRPQPKLRNQTVCIPYLNTIN